MHEIISCDMAFIQVILP